MHSANDKSEVIFYDFIVISVNHKSSNRRILRNVPFHRSHRIRTVASPSREDSWSEPDYHVSEFDMESYRVIHAGPEKA